MHKIVNTCEFISKIWRQEQSLVLTTVAFLILIVLACRFYLDCCWGLFLYIVILSGIFTLRIMFMKICANKMVIGAVILEAGMVFTFLFLYELILRSRKLRKKFQRENASLPLHLRRKLPPKPDGTVSQEEWNKLAWESSQSSLTPCTNCGRTFYPDRLVVHQRSCKAPLQNQHRAAQQQQQPSPAMAQRGPPPPPRSPAAAHQPPSVDCYVCGRPFGTHSIGIHERQCLRKWHQENDALPPDMRATPPVRRDGQTKANTPESADEKPQQRSSSNDGAGGAAREASGGSGGGGKRPPLFPCYLCGKLFSVHSIYLHEPQCLKRWQVENDRLPPSKRRPVPLKPDIKFTRDGGIDFEATNELNWQSHLSQLVPCKLCSRTFNPDRVAVHEKSCKGN